MLSRTNYDAVAEIFRVARTRTKLGAYQSPHKVLDALEVEFADYFARDNGRFDRDRFDVACVPRPRRLGTGGLWVE